MAPTSWARCEGDLIQAGHLQSCLSHCKMPVRVLLKDDSFLIKILCIYL